MTRRFGAACPCNPFPPQALVIVCTSWLPSLEAFFFETSPASAASASSARWLAEWPCSTVSLQVPKRMIAGGHFRDAQKMLYQLASALHGRKIDELGLSLEKRKIATTNRVKTADLVAELDMHGVQTSAAELGALMATMGVDEVAGAIDHHHLLRSVEHIQRTVDPAPIDRRRWLRDTAMLEALGKLAAAVAVEGKLGVLRERLKRCEKKGSGLVVRTEALKTFVSLDVDMKMQDLVLALAAFEQAETRGFLDWRDMYRTLDTWDDAHATSAAALQGKIRANSSARAAMDRLAHSLEASMDDFHASLAKASRQKNDGGLSWADLSLVLKKVANVLTAAEMDVLASVFEVESNGSVVTHKKVFRIVNEWTPEGQRRRLWQADEIVRAAMGTVSAA